MIYTDIFHSHKIGLFLGASLAVHAAVLSHWSTVPGNVTAAPASRSVRMVLSTAMESVESTVTAPPVAAANATEPNERSPAIEADPPAQTAPPVMPLADLDTAIRTSFQFLHAVQPAAIKEQPVKPRLRQTKVLAFSQPLLEKLPQAG